MRRTLNLLPLLLLMPSLSALSEQPASPSSGASHRVQVVRSGKGEPRVREAQAARKTSLRAPSVESGLGRTRPYQTPKTGEGVPKG